MVPVLERQVSQMTVHSGAACSVVGIGGSAGGIEALQQVLSAFRPDSAAFVVVTHLPADGRGQLAEVLGRYTMLEVQAAETGVVLQSNHIYVVPDSQNVTVQGGRLRFDGRSVTSRGPRNIDHLFASLAQEYGRDAIGVVLSGANRDGTAGLEAIRRAGGTTFVQAPETALFDVMPNSAAAAAQSSLAPAVLGRQLMQLLTERERLRTRTVTD